MVNRGCAFEMPDGLYAGLRRCGARRLLLARSGLGRGSGRGKKDRRAPSAQGQERRHHLRLLGLRTVESAQRLLETAALETLALENSIARNRTLISAAAGAGKLIEAGDLADRLADRRGGGWLEADIRTKTPAFPEEPAR